MIYCTIQGIQSNFYNNYKWSIIDLCKKQSCEEFYGKQAIFREQEKSHVGWPDNVVF